MATGGGYSGRSGYSGYAPAPSVSKTAPKSSGYVPRPGVDYTPAPAPYTPAPKGGTPVASSEGGGVKVLNPRTGQLVTRSAEDAARMQGVRQAQSAEYARKALTAQASQDALNRGFTFDPMFLSGRYGAQYGTSFAKPENTQRFQLVTTAEGRVVYDTLTQAMVFVPPGSGKDAVIAQQALNLSRASGQLVTSGTVAQLSAQKGRPYVSGSVAGGKTEKERELNRFLQSGGVYLSAEDVKKYGGKREALQALFPTRAYLADLVGTTGTNEYVRLAPESTTVRQIVGTAGPTPRPVPVFETLKPVGSRGGLRAGESLVGVKTGEPSNAVRIMRRLEEVRKQDELEARYRTVLQNQLSTKIGGEPISMAFQKTESQLSALPQPLGFLGSSVAGIMQGYTAAAEGTIKALANIPQLVKEIATQGRPSKKLILDYESALLANPVYYAVRPAAFAAMVSTDYPKFLALSGGLTQGISAPYNFPNPKELAALKETQLPPLQTAANALKFALGAKAVSSALKAPAEYARTKAAFELAEVEKAGGTIQARAQQFGGSTLAREVPVIGEEPALFSTLSKTKAQVLETQAANVLWREGKPPGGKVFVSPETRPLKNYAFDFDAFARKATGAEVEGRVVVSQDGVTLFRPPTDYVSPDLTSPLIKPPSLEQPSVIIQGRLGRAVRPELPKIELTNFKAVDAATQASLARTVKFGPDALKPYYENLPTGSVQDLAKLGVTEPKELVKGAPKQSNPLSYDVNWDAFLKRATESSDLTYTRKIVDLPEPPEVDLASLTRNVKQSTEPFNKAFYEALKKTGQMPKVQDVVVSDARIEVFRDLSRRVSKDRALIYGQFVIPTKKGIVYEPFKALLPAKGKSASTGYFDAALRTELETGASFKTTYKGVTIAEIDTRPGLNLEVFKSLKPLRVTSDLGSTASPKGQGLTTPVLEVLEVGKDTRLVRASQTQAVGKYGPLESVTAGIVTEKQLPPSPVRITGVRLGAGKSPYDKFYVVTNPLTKKTYIVNPKAILKQKPQAPPAPQEPQAPPAPRAPFIEPKTGVGFSEELANDLRVVNREKTLQLERTKPPEPKPSTIERELIAAEKRAREDFYREQRKTRERDYPTNVRIEEVDFTTLRFPPGTPEFIKPPAPFSLPFVPAITTIPKPYPLPAKPPNIVKPVNPPKPVRSLAFDSTDIRTQINAYRIDSGIQSGYKLATVSKSDLESIQKQISKSMQEVVIKPPQVVQIQKQIPAELTAQKSIYLQDQTYETLQRQKTVTEQPPVYPEPVAIPYPPQPVPPFFPGGGGGGSAGGFADFDKRLFGRVLKPVKKDITRQPDIVSVQRTQLKTGSAFYSIPSVKKIFRSNVYKSSGGELVPTGELLGKLEKPTKQKRDTTRAPRVNFLKKLSGLFR